MTDWARPDPWMHLRRFTSARIALGRAGASLPSREWLAFKTDHAAARAAVWAPFDASGLAHGLEKQGHDVLVVASAVTDRAEYLRRPDLGRKLADAGRALLRERAQHYDLVIIVSDGLSALAMQHALPVVRCLVTGLAHTQWHLAPLVVAAFGRVALQDEIGALLGARLALILLGERPGLGSPDSLGAYLVHAPRPGRIDADRNCVSNIRPAGLACQAAAETLIYLLERAHREQRSGVLLKDERRAADPLFVQEVSPAALPRQ